jgi:hypothetical protein
MHYEVRSARLATVLSLLAIVVFAESASAVAISSSTANIEVQRRNNGQYLLGQAQINTGERIGTQTGFGNPGTNLGGIDGVYFFQLPTLPAGQAVSTASFSVSELKEGSSGIKPTFNADLYAIGFDKNNPPDNEVPSGGFGTSSNASDHIAQAYFFAGSSQTGTGANGAPITKILDNFLVPDDWTAANASATENVAHTTGDNATLASYIQSLYENPNFTAGHDYIIMRLNPDADMYTLAGGSTQRYQVPYMQTPTGANGNGSLTTLSNVQYPELDVTYVDTPEPASIGIVGLAVAAGMLSRRRASR